MMTCDTMVRAEKALDDYENGGLSMSVQAAELLEKQVVAMKICHDIVAARISHQMEEATYGTGF